MFPFVDNHYLFFSLTAAWRPCPEIQPQREDLKAPLNLGQAGEVTQTANVVLSNCPGDGGEGRDIVVAGVFIANKAHIITTDIQDCI